MKINALLIASFLLLASVPLLSQQPSTAHQPNAPATTQQPPSTGDEASSNTPGLSSAKMSTIDGELANNFDSKTAKAGDSIVIQTKESAKTSDGTKIPTGSKLLGHVVGVQASQAGTNSQVVLLVDKVELKGGQSLPIHSQIQSLSPPSDAVSTNSSTGANTPSVSNASNPNTSGTNGGGSANNTPSAASSPSAETNKPAAGVVVAQNGRIDITTTSIPGVLLANNAPGQEDPRMAQASSILLGAKQDIQLASGTRMMVGVSVAPNNAQ